MNISSNIKPYNLPQHRRLGEPLLKFGNNAPETFGPHPLQGLADHGPFGKLRLAGIPGPIRIAFVGQASMLGRLRNLLRELNTKHEPRERRDYLPVYSGFDRIFATSLVPAEDAANIVLPEEIDTQLNLSDSPHHILAETLTGALSSLRTQRHNFDLVYMGLGSKWSSGFEGNEEEEFDLHDYLKAYSAAAGIPLQIIRDDKALDYRCRCSVMWRLGIATFTKAGGVPWALANTRPKTAYIGIDYALRPITQGKDRFAICCAQVFDSDGAGLDFIAYEAEDVTVYGRNPYMRKDQMLKVMARSLSIYQRQHAGEVPDRIVVHKNTDFRRDEIDGCLAAFSNVAEVELLQVQQSHGWQGVLFNKPKQADRFPSHRGQVLPIGEYEALLWSQGNIPSMAGSKGSYFKEGKGIPSPLLLTRFAGRGDFYDLCSETLALTKMNWNNDGPYTRLPVTLEYADVLAQVVKRMPKLEAKPYPVRLFM